jgi:hypothetical protein
VLCWLSRLLAFGVGLHLGYSRLMTLLWEAHSVCGTSNGIVTSKDRAVMAGIIISARLALHQDAVLMPAVPARFGWSSIVAGQVIARVAAMVTIVANVSSRI